MRRHPHAWVARISALESRSVLAKLAIVLGAFAIGVGVAELVGAKNLGTSFGVGQLTFAVALVYVLVRR
jgi:hypothetical protein